MKTKSTAGDIQLETIIDYLKTFYEVKPEFQDGSAANLIQISLINLYMIAYADGMEFANSVSMGKR